MEKPMRDEELLELLPDYLNNVLQPDMRRQIDAYLQRSAVGQQALANLQLLFETMEQLPPEKAPVEDPVRAQFMAYAGAHPLQGPQRAGMRTWLRNWRWLQPALALSLLVIAGQGVFIGQLMSVHPEPAGVRSLGRNDNCVPGRGPVLNILVNPDARYADLLALLHQIDGRIICSSKKNASIDVELGSMPVAQAKQALQRSKVVMNVMEVPLDHGP